MEKIAKFTYEDKISCCNRLDRFLSSKLPDHSRSYLQKLIEKEFVQVNRIIIQKSSLSLRKNDEVIIFFPPIKKYDPTPKNVDFEVLDIQDDFMVINKPAGLVVHPAENCKEEASLVHGLLYKFKEFSNFKDTKRPGIVHRIDKNSSGLLLVARNITSQAKLSEMFKNRLIKKTYIAVVKGHPPKEGKIDYTIGRNPTYPNKMSHVGFNSKEALTYYNVLEYYKECTLISVNIVTGRTHQIRVHFTAIGHSIVGDTTYGNASKLINRQALHAWKLTFPFKNKNYSYNSPLPTDFKKLIKNLKKIKCSKTQISPFPKPKFLN